MDERIRWHYSDYTILYNVMYFAFVLVHGIMSNTRTGPNQRLYVANWAQKLCQYYNLQDSVNV